MAIVPFKSFPVSSNSFLTEFWSAALTVFCGYFLFYIFTFCYCCEGHILPHCVNHCIEQFVVVVTDETYVHKVPHQSLAKLSTVLIFFSLFRQVQE